MRRALVIGSFGFLLGCSGLAEGLAELLSGSEIDHEGDQVILKNADGTTQVITQGADVVLPEGFPLPLPPGDLTVTSVVDSSDGGAKTVLYQLDDDVDADAIVAFYEQWFADEGIDVVADHKNMAGMRTSAMVASRDGEVYAVTFTDALGSRMLNLTVTPMP